MIDLASNTQANKIVKFLNYIYTVKAFNAIVTTPRNCLNWKKKSNKIQVTLLNYFFVIFLVVVVTHNTFAQLNIPRQDLPLWLF